MVGAPPGCPSALAVWCRQVSASVLLSLVTLYIIFCLLLPLLVKICNNLRWRINNIITSETYTYSSSSRGLGSLSEARSSVESKVRSKFPSKVAEENEAGPKEIVKKVSLT